VTIVPESRVYTVTVKLEVHAQSSPSKVLEWLEDALAVDGMLVTKISIPKLKKEAEDVDH
jgi:hypothetical protein